jgi:hypothetical protein
MNASPVLLQKKCVRVIECFAKKKHISLGEALDCFYKSDLYTLIHEGVSDLHCMSDQYLADELEEEYRKKNISDRSADDLG